MKTYTYTFGALVLALSMNSLPALALAENNGGEGQGEVSVQGVAQTNTVVRVDEEGRGNSASSSVREQTQQLETASTSDQRPQIKGGDQEGQEISLELEDDNSPALSLNDLQQKIEVRKQQLDQEAASSTPDHQVAVEHANEVRLAVHTLLASKDLIGGIGGQVSEIARQINDSVATTTNAEAKIQSRGFLTRLFFGGDTTSADVIAREAAQNQARIDSLTALLAQANISADVQATLTAQITALKDAQARLQDLAQREQKAWGLFSWRF